MKKTIIYILGGARSGTTLLDIVLGNSAGILSCGELMRFVETQGEPPEVSEDTNSYRFWNRIVLRMSEKYSGQMDFESLFRIARKFEYHRSVLRTYFGFNLDKDVSIYRTYNKHLFESIFESVDETGIIDSSKWPSRALALYKYTDYDIRFIYLVRNPVMVVRSFSKTGLEQGPKGYFVSNIYYFLVNLVCRLVLRKLKGAPVISVKYEDFISNPVQELARIQEMLDLDLSDSITLAEQEKEFQVANLFEGNRTRHQSVIRLHKSTASPVYDGIKDRITMIINGVWWR